jgi:hypothetical protein
VVAVVTPQVLIAAHGQRVAVAARPLVEEHAVLVEHLDAAVETVRHIHVAVVAYGDPVRYGELAVGFAWLHRTPPQQRLSLFAELHHAAVGVAVAHEERPVRQPIDHRRPVEVLEVVVGTEDAHLSEREHLRLAVVGELVNHMIHVVDDPDVTLRVVRLDVNLVRSAPASNR